MAKAIAMLREKLGLTQDQFAKKLGVSPFSISRYESGRGPSRAVVMKLAAVAAEKRFESLEGFFQKSREADIEASYQKRASAGTGRHVPLDDLKLWSTRLRSIVDSTLEALRQTDPEFRAAAIFNAKVTADFLRDDIQLYIGDDPTHSSTGLQEDDKRLKQDKYLLRSYVRAWEKREFGDR